MWIDEQHGTVMVNTDSVASIMIESDNKIVAREWRGADKKRTTGTVLGCYSNRATAAGAKEILALAIMLGLPIIGMPDDDQSSVMMSVRELRALVAQKDGQEDEEAPADEQCSADTNAAGEDQEGEQDEE